jgi:hypothetical protein
MIRSIFARTEHSWSLSAVVVAIQELYSIPQDMPDQFVKAFARLDASEVGKNRDRMPKKKNDAECK